MAIILPASTNPLQLVQADRFLDKRKTDPKLPIDEKWDDSVKALVNYPDVVKMMSGDLDWTSALGEAVVADQGAVLEAIQAFRRRAEAAGNLKSNDKQVVTVEKTVIQIVPANPEVIYVPQYNPTTVVVAGAPAWGYYPTPYPVYYYPYPPGAAFATGLIWGAAIGAAWNGGHWNTNWGGGDININRNTNINTGNINRGNVNTGNVNRGNVANSRDGRWRHGVEVGQEAGPGERRDRTHEHRRACRRCASRWRRRCSGAGAGAVPRVRPRRRAVDSSRRLGRGRGRQSSVDATFGRAWAAAVPAPRTARAPSARRRATISADRAHAGRLRRRQRVGRLRLRPPDADGQLARSGEPQLDVGAAARRRLVGGGGGGAGEVVVVVGAAAAGVASSVAIFRPTQSTGNEPDESDQDDDQRPAAWRRSCCSRFRSRRSRRNRSHSPHPRPRWTR